MAYQAGTATDRFDLINKLRIFAEALGWVTDDLRAAAEGDNGYWFCHNAAATGYWSFFMDTPSALTMGKCINIVSNTGYTPGNSAVAQPGGLTTGMRTNLYSEPYVGYDFFGTAQYLHVVVQISAGRFRHFGIGEIDNKTAYSGGQYSYGNVKGRNSITGDPDPNPNTNLISGVWHNVFGACNSNSNLPATDTYAPYYRASHVRVNGQVDFFSTVVGTISAGHAPKGIRASGPGGGHILSTEANPDAGLVALSRTNFAQLVNLVPFNVYIELPDEGWRLMGNPVDIAVCRMTSIGAKDILNIAGEDWMIIPALQYQPVSGIAPAGQETSWDLGYAYRMEL